MRRSCSNAGGIGITVAIIRAALGVGKTHLSIALGREAILAGYTGNTRRSYATDLRLFAMWCRDGSLSLFTVRSLMNS